MEEMLGLVLFGMIAFSIFQVILFFKIWGMTNDVKEVKNKITNSDNEKIVWEIRRFILKEDKEKAENLLFDLFLRQLEYAVKIYQGESLTNRISVLKRIFAHYYSQIKSTFPASLQNINTKEDIEKIFKLQYPLMGVN
ncbi:hypothetical protein [Parabacteroides pacaensis]|uniref:hypothetical protein n=1 Tax=Parabacteroides pacaensis TaxID=2086575 RepID=UPI000D0F99F8|nr:hypothetical protein [Parabacteroides pacaensis]